MNNNKNEKLSECESLQISVLSDEELTDELKRHLESCGECRAFLQQNSRIKDELSGLGVPGLKDGEIADRVMKEIRTSKSISFPRVRLTHHIGTAAALVIVIALFAANKGYDLTSMISSKNGADNSQNEKISDTADTADAGSGFTPINGVFTSSDGETNSKTSAENSENTAAEDNETSGAASEQGTDANAPAIIFSMVPRQNSSPDSDMQDDPETSKRTVRYSSYQDSPEYYSGGNDSAAAKPPKESAVQENSVTDGPRLSLSGAVSAPNETNSAVNSQPDFKMQQESAAADENPDASMPSGGSSKPNKAPAANSDIIDFEDDRAGFYESVSETYNSIFEGIEFNQSDDALGENVTSANKYVKSIFDEASQLRTEALTNIGITNSMFIEWAGTVENAEQYSFESIYEYFSR